jgi:cytochrome c peroxidase
MLSLTTHRHSPSAVLAIVTALGVGSAFAQDGSVSLSPAALREIAQVEAEIDRIEAQALERLSAPPDNQVQQIELLGKAMLYDKHLSVNRNEACAVCHMPQTGFTGPVSELNATTGAYPRIPAHALQRPQATDPQLRTALSCPAFQSGARRPCRR